MRKRSLAVLAIVPLLIPSLSSAQIPVQATGLRLDVAEVRALDVTSTDPEVEFETTAAKGPVFKVSAKAVIARFRSPKPPSDPQMYVVWASIPSAGQLVEIRRDPIESTKLAAGVTSTLSAGEKALARGRYRVSLVGANGTYHRTLEFWVGARPPGGRREKVYFDQYSFLYPGSYTPQPVIEGMTGMMLIRSKPYGLMFVFLSKEGSDTVLPQGRVIVDVWLNRLSSMTTVANVEAWDIPKDELAPDMVFGKGITAKLTRGLVAEAFLYSKWVDGRKVVMGYGTITGKGVPADYESLLTPNRDDAAQEFFAMAESLKGGTPWGPKTPGERHNY